MNTQETAEYLGISEDDLILSRVRGLQPGSLGYRHDSPLRDGELAWDPADLTEAGYERLTTAPEQAPGEPEADSLDSMTKKKLLAHADALGVEVVKSWKKDKIKKAIKDVAP